MDTKGLASMKDSGIKSMRQNEQLGEELHKPIIRKSKKEKYIRHLRTIFRALI